MIRLEITSRLASAQLYLQGAHLTQYQPVGAGPVLYTSPNAFYARQKAIRGGAPVIFPWFAQNATDSSLPMHGFARTAEWEVESIEPWPDGACQVTLRLVADDATRALWPHDFILRYRVTVGRKLEMALEVENWSGGEFRFEEALHTYIAVRDIRQTRVLGLQGGEYIDKVDGFRRKREEAPGVEFKGELDRVYLSTKATCTVDDPSAVRVVRITKENSDTTVVWNPGEVKATALADLGAEVWPRFVCVETANAGENAVTLQHGETHTMRAAIAVE